jgi:hypothetical protein
MEKLTPSSLASRPSATAQFSARVYDAKLQYSPNQLDSCMADFSTQTFDIWGHPQDNDND